MRRRILVLVNYLALLACPVIVVLWILGYLVVAGFVITAGEREIHLFGARGGIFLAVFPQIPPSRIEFVRLPTDAVDPLAGVFIAGRSFAGFHGIWEAQGYRAVIIPHWALLLVSATTAIVLSRRLRRARGREERNLCRNCGYDLRASPERCPECGLAVSSANNEIETADGRR